jgi:hypothetical protein
MVSGIAHVVSDLPGTGSCCSDSGMKAWAFEPRASVMEWNHVTAVEIVEILASNKVAVHSSGVKSGKQGGLNLAQGIRLDVLYSLTWLQFCPH